MADYQHGAIFLTEEQRYRNEHPGVLRLYDITLDEFRDATQGDIDFLMEACTRLGQFRSNAQALNDSLRTALEAAWMRRSDA